MVRSRCINADAPPAQPWQHPLPHGGHRHVSRQTVYRVHEQLQRLVARHNWQRDRNIGLLARLGWQCISTFRATDYLGGCNGGRIRLGASQHLY